MAELEEQVDQRTSDLSAAMEEKERLKNSLDQEREGKQVSGVVCRCVSVIIWV